MKNCHGDFFSSGKVTLLEVSKKGLHVPPITGSIAEGISIQIKKQEKPRFQETRTPSFFTIPVAGCSETSLLKYKHKHHGVLFLVTGLLLQSRRGEGSQDSLCQMPGARQPAEGWDLTPHACSH